MAETQNPLDQFAQGVTGLFGGPAGTGKSRLLGSIGELVSPDEVVLIAPKAREINSALYQKYGFDKNAVVFADLNWRPAAGKFEADGFKRLMNFLYTLYDDTKIKVVIVDPITDVGNLIAHEVLKAEQATSAADLRDKLGYYGSVKHRWKDFATTLTGLSSKALKQPKHVFASVHVQPAKEDDVKGNATAEKDAKGISYFGDVMPMLEGSYRQEIAAEFDMVGFTTIKHDVVRVGTKMERQTRFVVQLAPDSEKHAKVAIAENMLGKEFPNDLPEILRAVVAARQQVA